jgi:ACT domain-containing protein
LSPEPLFNFVADRQMVDVVAEIKMSRNTFWQYKKGKQIPYLTADKIAISLGVHPTHIWGDEWLTVISDDMDANDD